MAPMWMVLPTGEDFVDLPQVSPGTVLISSGILITTTSGDGFIEGVENCETNFHPKLVFRAQNSAHNLIDAFRVHQIDKGRRIPRPERSNCSRWHSAQIRFFGLGRRVPSRR